MHYLMLITLTMQPGETSDAARDRTCSLLLADPTFCGDGGRFGSPLCDSFVIGGGWSGHLRKSLIAPAYVEALKQRFPKLADDCYRVTDAEPHRADLDALWRQFGGDGPSPFNRDRYQQTGYGDDALAVDQAVYERFVERYRDKADCDDGACRFADLDGDAVDDWFVGCKWLIVIDYHI